jgi:hypothetical protein
MARFEISIHRGGKPDLMLWLGDTVYCRRPSRPGDGSALRRQRAFEPLQARHRNDAFAI